MQAIMAMSYEATTQVGLRSSLKSPSVTVSTQWSVSGELTAHSLGL